MPRQPVQHFRMEAPGNSRATTKATATRAFNLNLESKTPGKKVCVRFRQDMFYPVHTDELHCPLEPGDSLPLHTNPHMAVLDRLWTDELTDGEADHVAAN